jgi:sugar phosphate isomerase/epimerase
MYRNLNCEALGVSGRQSEIIELSLTYRFGGMDLNMAEFRRQVEVHSLDHARRFIDSAKIKIGGFELPVRWQADDATYRADLAKLPPIVELAGELGAQVCRTVVSPTCADRPYHENFEFHRHRLTEVAEVLGPVRLGMDFLAPTYHREDSQFHFISSAEPLVLLAKTINMPNLGVVLDSWNWYVGGNGMDLIQELSVDQIVSVRLADAATDVERETLREEGRLLPGQGGAIDNVAILRRLMEIGYEGSVTPYANPSIFGSMTRDNIVKDASDSLDEAWKAAAAPPQETTPAVAAASE